MNEQVLVVFPLDDRPVRLKAAVSDHRHSVSALDGDFGFRETLIRIADFLRLRLGEMPVVARVAGDRVLLDPRTLRDADVPVIAAALAAIAADVAADAEDGA